MLSKLYWQAYFRARNTRAYWRQLDQFQLASPTEQRHIIATRLLSQIQYFGNRSDALPEWREAAKIRTPEEIWAAWPSLPILTKKDLQSQFQPEETRDNFGIDGKINKTGGSTGEPTRFLWDKASLATRSAAQYYCWHKFGWFPGQPTLCLWGSPRDLGLSSSRKITLLQKLQNLTIIDGFTFDSSTLDRTLRYLESQSGIAIYGYSSLLDQLASAVKEKGIPVPREAIRVAWNGAEGITPEQAENFSSVFGPSIQNQYGGREFGALAYQSNTSEKSLTILRPSVHIEVVDEDGKPCNPGESGRVLVTSLNGRGTPFLRYENGDLVTIADDGLGRSGIRSLQSIDGRKSGLVRLRKGRLVHNAFWGMLFKEFSEIRQFQVRQQKDLSISISLVGSQPAVLDDDKLHRLLLNTLQDTPFTIQWVDHIPLSPQGKLIQVHSDAE